jgi:hypothetical protein
MNDYINFIYGMVKEALVDYTTAQEEGRKQFCNQFLGPSLASHLQMMDEFSSFDLDTPKDIKKMLYQAYSIVDDNNYKPLELNYKGSTEKRSLDKVVGF